MRFIDIEKVRTNRTNIDTFCFIDKTTRNRPVHVQFDCQFNSFTHGIKEMQINLFFHLQYKYILTTILKNTTFNKVQL